MAKQRKKADKAVCPCGGISFAECCEPFLMGKAAPSAEALMRSRYSAYTKLNADYLLDTWHSSARPSIAELNLDPTVKWLGLEVRACGKLNDADAQAFVEFVARYKPSNSPAQRLHERSRFCFENGRWFYLDGQIFD